jgi:hypothetical protein
MNPANTRANIVIQYQEGFLLKNIAINPFQVVKQTVALPQ